MCTIFVHLPKCFNAIFRFWFRFGKFVFFFLSLFLALFLFATGFIFVVHFILFQLAITELLQFICFSFFDIFGSMPCPFHQNFGFTYLSTLPHHSHRPLPAYSLTYSLLCTLYDSILRTCSRNAASLNV